MTEPAIRLSDVSLTLGQGASKVDVLRQVDLEIMAGEAAGIVGPSGSGKTTLLMVLAGLEGVDCGVVEIAGETITDMSEDQMAAFRGRNVGIVFQSFHLIPNMTALENVAVPLELAGIKDAFALAEAELTAVGLKDRITHYPGELSGGEQQRVAIARANGAFAAHPGRRRADRQSRPGDRTPDRRPDLRQGARARHHACPRQRTIRRFAARCDRQIAMRSGRIETRPLETAL